MKRPLLIAGAAAFCAAALREFIFYSPSFNVAFVAVSLGLAVLFALCAVFIPKRRALFISAVLFATVFSAVSGIWAAKNDVTLSVGQAYSGSEETCTVYIYREPTLTANGYYRYFGRIESPESLKDTKIVFYGFTEENISVGDRVFDTFRFDAGERNYYYRYNGVTFFAERVGETSVTEGDKYDFNVVVNKIKIAAESKLSYLFGDTSDVVKGFLFGDTSDIDPDVKEDFRAAGISHLLAVSGLHVGIIALFFTALFSKAGFKYLQYLLAAVAVFLLAALSGFSPSVVRALIMQFILLLGNVVSRRSDTKNTFGLALLLLVVFDPFIVSSPSFLLSFASTAAIVFLYEPVSGAVVNFLFVRFSIRPGKFFGKIISVVIVSVLCTAVSFPISYACFGTASLLGVVGNILIFPFVSFSFIFAVVALLTSFLPLISFIALPFAYISKIGVLAIMYAARLTSLLTGTASDFTLSLDFISDGWMIIAVVLLAAAVLILSEFLRRGKKKSRKNVVGIIIAAVILISSVGFFTDRSSESTRPDGSAEVTFIDVGQGSSTVIISEDKVYVFDCGGTTEPGDRCADYILSQGYDEIETLVISHMHDDHMNGVRTLVERVKTKKVIIPYTSPDPEEDEALKEYLDKFGTRLSVLYEDTSLALSDGATIDLLVGHMTDNADENDNSILLFLDFGDSDLLLCGDLSKVGEKRVIKYYPDLDTDIYAVGHHGSKYSACEEFLEQITPTASVISCAEKNSYGHPNAETVSRLEKYGPVYYTMKQGNITFILDGEDYFVKEAA